VNCCPKHASHGSIATPFQQRGQYLQILSDFRAGNLQVLIGTQMAARGLDFPRVTLVGVVSADTGLYLPDFRASERVFQLLTQVIGRAGRREQRGRALIQTYNPDHPAVQCALRQDYEAFYCAGTRAASRGRLPAVRAPWQAC
jgi:primosomal protein N' (replication factor Y)